MVELKHILRIQQHQLDPVFPVMEYLNNLIKVYQLLNTIIDKLIKRLTSLLGFFFLIIISFKCQLLDLVKAAVLKKHLS